MDCVVKDLFTREIFQVLINKKIENKARGDKDFSPETFQANRHSGVDDDTVIRPPAPAAFRKESFRRACEEKKRGYNV